jgi:hypothetical protein
MLDPVSEENRDEDEDDEDDEDDILSIYLLLFVKVD